MLARLTAKAIWAAAAIAMAFFGIGLLGLARWRLAQAWQRRWVNVLWAAWALYPL